MKKYAFVLAVLLGSLCFLPTVRADGDVKVTQVDPSGFPEVVLYVNVTDESGRPVAMLEREDFRLVEDGKEVEIKDFAGIGDIRPVDIVFVFDTTSSMYDEIDGVKNTCVRFAEKLREANRDFRLGLITFGDEIRAVYGGEGLTDDAEVFKGWIGAQTADGGDDTPEISLDGVEEATRLTYRPDAQKILILITDAPPHEENDGTYFSHVNASTLTTQLRDTGYTVYAVTYGDDRFRQIASETHGEFYDLQASSDFTGIIDKIGGQIASQYRMTYLSARPSYDGTRRGIEVEVAGQKAEGTYLEKHLINVRSSPLIAALFMIPLLVALVVPMLPKRRASGQPLPAPTPADALPVAPAPAVRYTSEPPIAAPAARPVVAPAAAAPCCPHCGSPVRAGAKFCGQCRQPIPASAAAAPQPAAPTAMAPVIPPAAATPAAYCPSCGAPVRAGAKFCAACGHKMS